MQKSYLKKYCNLCIKSSLAQQGVVPICAEGQILRSFYIIFLRFLLSHSIYDKNVVSRRTNRHIHTGECVARRCTAMYCSACAALSQALKKIHNKICVCGMLIYE